MVAHPTSSFKEPFEEPENCSKLNCAWVDFWKWYNIKKEGFQVLIQKTGSKITGFFVSFRKRF